MSRRAVYTIYIDRKIAIPSKLPEKVCFFRTDRKIRYNPSVVFTVRKDGFFGEFYQPQTDCYPGKCMIVCGGSMGLFLLNQMMAEQFADVGMNVMIIAYHGQEELPQDLKDQPADVVEKAALWLKKHDFEKIGLWGISMGGTLVLIAATLRPDLFSCVVAVSTAEMNTQAELKNDKGLLEGSSFSWHGKPLPYMKYVPSDSKEWLRKYKRDSLKHREPYAKDILKDSYLANDNPVAVIPIWNIHGSILLLGRKNDSMCPIEDTIQRMEKQLREHHFTFPYETHLYEHIGHLLLPVRPYSTMLFREERKDKKGCIADRIQFWQDTLQFLKEKW